MTDDRSRVVTIHQYADNTWGIQHEQTRNRLELPGNVLSCASRGEAVTIARSLGYDVLERGPAHVEAAAKNFLGALWEWQAHCVRGPAEQAMKEAVLKELRTLRDMAEACLQEWQ